MSDNAMLFFLGGACFGMMMTLLGVWIALQCLDVRGIL